VDQPNIIRGCIYLITNFVTGKRYVGCTTKTIEERWIEHKSTAKGGSSAYLHKSIRKYGSGFFRIECLESVVGTREDLHAAEIRFIAYHDCMAPKGYNLTHGGDGGDYSVSGVRERHTAAMKRIAADPDWKAANQEQLRQQHADPAWQAANVAGILKAQAAHREAAIARDAHLPSEVRERRARRRERDRLRKNQMYAQRKVA
jgi:group I intron endonuclease